MCYIFFEVISVYYNEKIALIRESKNIRQKDIAAHLGIKQQQYARYEKGINVMPVTYLGPICAYLQVSADYILGLPKGLPYPPLE